VTRPLEALRPIGRQPPASRGSWGTLPVHAAAVGGDPIPSV